MNVRGPLVAALVIAMFLVACGDGGTEPTGGHPESTTLAEDITPPPDAAPLDGVAALSAGAYHVCALDDGGDVLCWGANDFGQLGDGTTSDRPLAGPVSFDRPMRQVAAGFYNTCAIDGTATLYCWGSNVDGVAGDGTTEPRTTPALVGGLPTPVTDVTVGREHACAVAGGSVWCWGNNTFGQLGAATQDIIQTTPLEVAGLEGEVLGIGAGWFHTCALMAPGDVWCWGNNQTAQLGPDTEEAQQQQPVRVSGLPGGVAALAVGGGHNCVLTSEGAVACWGANNYGQTGDGTTSDRAEPLTVELGGTATWIAVGTGQSCAAVASRGVLCWGHDWYGELGDGTQGEGNNLSQPTAVQGLPDGVTSFAMGRFHTCALTDASAPYCWGRNGFGEIGDGTRMQRGAAVRVVAEPS